MNRRKNRRDSVKMFEALETRRLMTVTPDPGSDFASAYNVGTLKGAHTFSDKVGNGDNADIYKFTLARDGYFNGRCRAYNAPATIYLFQKTSSGSIVYVTDRTANQSGPDGGFASGDFTKYLTAGDYYVEVDPVSAATDYLVRFTSDYAGNTLGTARDIGVATEGIFNDFVGNFGSPTLDDANDTYKFKMDADGALLVSYAHDSEFSDPTTFRSHLEVIKDSNNNGVINAGETLGTSPTSNAGAVFLNLTKGTYFVRVVTDLNYQNYQLRVNADYAPNSIGQHRDVTSTMENGASFTDWIANPNDRWDNYTFTLNGSRPFYASYSGTGGNAVLSLYRDADNDGKIDSNELIDSTDSASSATMLTSLPSGKYFLQVGSPTGKGNYTLYMRAKADSVGNTLSAAKNLGTVNGLASLQSEAITNSDMDDFYKFSLSADGSVSASLNSYTGFDEALALIKDSNGNGKVDSGDTLASTQGNLTRLDRITQSLKKGTYFLRVFVTGPFGLRSPTAGLYNLSFFTDYAGNTAPAARQLGTLSGTKEFNDYATQNYGDGSDQYDFYKFSLSSSKLFSAKMVGTLSGEDLDIQIYLDKNNDGQISSNEIVAVSAKKNSPNESISKTLAKGNYFVRVYGVNGDTNYKLTLKA